MLKRIGVFLGSSLLAASALLAQTSGTILGNVHDTSGAEIGGATITITNLDRGTSQTAISNEAGDYLVPFLPPGNYQLSVEKNGFQKEHLRRRYWMLISGPGLTSPSSQEPYPKPCRCPVRRH